MIPWREGERDSCGRREKNQNGRGFKGKNGRGKEICTVKSTQGEVKKKKNN